MKRLSIIPELGTIGAESFNLSTESALDGARLLLERAAEDKRRQEAAEYQERMQRTLSECPGFVGGDLPRIPGGGGYLVVEPACARAAVEWLRKRVHVDDAAEIQETGELKVQIWARRKAMPGGARRMAVKFGKVEQFNLELGL